MAYSLRRKKKPTEPPPSLDTQPKTTSTASTQDIKPKTSKSSKSSTVNTKKKRRAAQGDDDKTNKKLTRHKKTDHAHISDDDHDDSDDEEERDDDGDDDDEKPRASSIRQRRKNKTQRPDERLKRTKTTSDDDGSDSNDDDDKPKSTRDVTVVNAPRDKDGDGDGDGDGKDDGDGAKPQRKANRGEESESGSGDLSRECSHLGHIVFDAANKTLLNPVSWSCQGCGTTESVWACLTCGYTACGRYQSGHAKKHFKSTKHPIALEINSKLCHCYECDGYVTNDNAKSEIATLRDTLEQLQTHTMGASKTRSGRVLKGPHPIQDPFADVAGQYVIEDKRYTALKHWKMLILAKAFNAWKQLLVIKKLNLSSSAVLEPSSPPLTSSTTSPPPSPSPTLPSITETNDATVIEFSSPSKQFTTQTPLSPVQTPSITTPSPSQTLTTPSPSPSFSPLPSLSSSTSLVPFSSRRRKSGKKSVSDGETSDDGDGDADADAATTPMATRLRSPAISLMSSLTSPLSPSKMIFKGQTGLRNLGNTCFMNSILQALSNTEEFREFFIQLLPPPDPQSTLNKENTENVNTAPPTTGEAKNSGGVVRRLVRQSTMECLESVSKKRVPKVEDISLCAEMHRLMRVMWSGKWAVVTPFALLASIWKFVPKFRNHQQQDAQEFLCYLLDRLHTELLSPQDREKKIAQRSIVNNVFEGKLKSEVVCQKCKTVSAKTEPFQDLTLDIPSEYVSVSARSCKTRSAKETKETKEKEKKGAKECSLGSCLGSYTAPERLVDMYVCDTCKAKQTVVKRLSIQSLPKVLLLVLKRFCFTAQTRSKIDTIVRFPITLDMAPYTSEKGMNTKYRLFAIVIHHGTGLTSGHYTAMCYNPFLKCWINFNDSQVSLVTEKEVLDAEPYMLFYEKVKK